MVRKSQSKKGSSKPKTGQRKLDSFKTPARKTATPGRTKGGSYVNSEGDIQVRSYKRRAWGTVSRDDYKKTSTYRRYYKYEDKSGKIRNK